MKKKCLEVAHELGAIYVMSYMLKVSTIKEVGLVALKKEVGLELVTRLYHCGCPYIHLQKVKVDYFICKL
jgi:hypothetical protein